MCKKHQKQFCSLALPGPGGGAYNAPSDTLVGFQRSFGPQGLTDKGEEEGKRERGDKEKKKEKIRERRGEGGRGRSKRGWTMASAWSASR